MGKLIDKAASGMRTAGDEGFQEVAEGRGTEEPEDGGMAALPPCVGPAHAQSPFLRIMAWGWEDGKHTMYCR